MEAVGQVRSNAGTRQTPNRAPFALESSFQNGGEL